MCIRDSNGAFLYHFLLRHDDIVAALVDSCCFAIEEGEGARRMGKDNSGCSLPRKHPLLALLEDRIGLVGTINLEVSGGCLSITPLQMCTQEFDWLLIFFEFVSTMYDQS